MMVAVDFSPRMGSIVVTRRGATVERHGPVRSFSRRSATPASMFGRGPWAQAHGYHRCLAPRERRECPNSRRLCAEHQPQQLGSGGVGLGLSGRMLLTRCGWVFDHSRAPDREFGSPPGLVRPCGRATIRLTFPRWPSARVAQLDRVAPSEGEGCGFNSRRAHQLLPLLRRSRKPDAPSMRAMIGREVLLLRNPTPRH